MENLNDHDDDFYEFRNIIMGPDPYPSDYPTHYNDSYVPEFDKRRRLDSSSSQDVASNYSFMDTAFSDFAANILNYENPTDSGHNDLQIDTMCEVPLHSPISPSKFRMRWTPEMDALLLEGVKRFTEYGSGMWKRVAEYVQRNLKQPIQDENGNILDTKITNHQCGERYKHHLDPLRKARNCGPWTKEEIEKLHELVEQNQINESGFTQSGRKKAQINWIKISAALNRNYRDCQHKWATISKSSLKSGAFTAEESDYIIRRVAEWGDKGPGIWSLLEEELGRKSRSIHEKYHRLVRKRKLTPSATPSFDSLAPSNHSI